MATNKSTLTNRRHGSRSRPHPSQATTTTINNFSNRIIDRIVMREVSSLKDHLRKTRNHDGRSIDTIKGSFTQFGILVPIIIDENGVVLAGDGRVEAARQLGIRELPCVQIDHLTEVEKRAYKIADNRLAELAGWDLPELEIELNFLTDLDFSMDAIGFTTPEIDLISQEVNAAEPEADNADDAFDLPIGAATSRLGDVWLLGKHRLICGSALDADVLQKVMAGDEARMVLTDAPYNVAINGFVGGLGKVQHREFAMASGEMSDAEFFDFLTEASKVAINHLIDGGLLYGFMDWRGLATYMAALNACDLKLLNMCVWNKGTGGMGSLYRSQHELCLVYKKGKAPHLNNVQLGQNGRYRTNVWDHPGMSSFGKGRDEALKLHPTVKPVNLLVEAIKDVTEVNDIVLDPFLGSGSTLIAAHRSHRICRGVEIDPLYVDTIVRRFEAFAGIEATHAETGNTFDQTKINRERDAVDQSAVTQHPSPPDEMPITIRKRVRVVAAKELENV